MKYFLYFGYSKFSLSSKFKYNQFKSSKPKDIGVYKKTPQTSLLWIFSKRKFTNKCFNDFNFFPTNIYYTFNAFLKKKKGPVYIKILDILHQITHVTFALQMQCDHELLLLVEVIDRKPTERFSVLKHVSLSRFTVYRA